jgi:CHAT domain-containing protein/tetratricopeptide (TPR) repeat protein
MYLMRDRNKLFLVTGLILSTWAGACVWAHAQAPNRAALLQQAQGLEQAAAKLNEQGNPEQALPIAQKSVDLYEQAWGAASLDLTEKLNNLALLYKSAGHYAQAEPLYRRALAMWEKAFGLQHPVVATGLSNLSALCQDLGRLEEAETLARQALAIREKTLGPNSEDTADSLSNLALLLDNSGRYAEAEPLYKRAVAIWEKVLGPDSLRLSVGLNNLACLYEDWGRYGEAEPLLRRALRIREKVLGPEHRDTATCLNNLGALYRTMARYTEAEPLYRRALAIWEKALGPEHPNVASALSNLASLCDDLGRSAEAEALHKRALAIREKVLGPDHPDTATSLNNLAVLYVNTGRYGEAEPLLVRTLKLREAAYGPEAPSVASSLNNLASVYRHSGRNAEAEGLFARCLAIRRKVLGPDHPLVASTLSNRAWLYAGTQRLPAALADFQEALRIENHLAATLFAMGSPRQRAELAGNLASTTDAALTLCAGTMTDDPQARRLGLEICLARKGWLLASELAEVRAARLASDPQAGQVFGQLRRVREQLARMAYTTPPPDQEADFHNRWSQLQGTQEALESDLAHLSAESAATTARTRANLGAVARSLPQDSALVEFMTYQASLFTAASERSSWGDWQYVAYVLRPGADTPECVPLGSAETIDEAVRALRRGKTLWGMLGAGLEVSDRVWKPLEAHLTGVKRVILSPDGELAMLPFASLPRSGPSGPEFLCERYVLQLVNSGRDLIPVARPQTAGAVLLGDPDFKGKAAAPPPTQPTAGPLRGVTLTPLPQTRLEVQQIGQRLREAGVATRVLLGAQATKTAVSQLAAPALVHLATHGFFLPDTEAPGSGAGDRSHNRRTYLHDPMHRSGLAFAGAQRLFSGATLPVGQDNGVLTAGEVAGLNLQGTRLVVLSACDTGLGEVQRGEGVMGLRRAFAGAGAQAVMMSLWQVPDEATRHLMVDFYERYLVTGDAAAALAEAQRAALAAQRAAGRVEPWAWGAFVVCGAS